ncbi:MAG: hypothetical protein ACRES8_01475 [Nevskiaceae bacterium]
MFRTLAAVTALLLAGCALNSEVRTTDEPDAALIFGFFDMKEAPFELGCVRITQDEKKGIAYPQSCMKTFADGLFFIENVPPMKYHVPFFYAGGKLHMISSDQEDTFSVRAKSMYFLGSFKYKVVTRDLGDILKLTPEQYGLMPVKAPGEKAVLKMLQDRVQDPRWKQRIKAKLGQ